MSFPVYNRGLVYHKVSNKVEWGLTTTTPRQFKAQMLELKRLGFLFTTVRDSDLNPDAIMVTFDDGYDNIKQFAAPIMHEVGAVATIFAITDYVGKKNSWDYFKEEDQILHMPWADLQELSDRGWEIGSHGCSHRRMINMDPKNAREELTRSKSVLEDKLGKQVTTFCPPFNAWNNDVLDMIEQAGYDKVAISFPVGGLPNWSGKFITRMGVYIHDLMPLYVSKIRLTPLSPLSVFQQLFINMGGDGRILENWLPPVIP